MKRQGSLLCKDAVYFVVLVTSALIVNSIDTDLNEIEKNREIFYGNAVADAC
jgi:hypothetical protein